MYRKCTSLIKFFDKKRHHTKYSKLLCCGWGLFGVVCSIRSVAGVAVMSAALPERGERVTGRQEPGR